MRLLDINVIIESEIIYYLQSIDNKLPGLTSTTNHYNEISILCMIVPNYHIIDLRFLWSEQTTNKLIYDPIKHYTYLGHISHIDCV